MSRKQDTASRRGADEIVEEIVDHLRPWKSHESVAAITAAVNHELEVPLKLAPLQAKLFDRARNRAHAKKLEPPTEAAPLIGSALTCRVQKIRWRRPSAIASHPAIMPPWGLGGNSNTSSPGNADCCAQPDGAVYR
jgi:hypothetical protein